MDILEYLKAHPFVLAPMAGVTDNAFRSFMKDLGAGLMVTELVSAHGIQHKSEQTLKLLEFSKTQSPIGVQIFGEDPLIMGQAAGIVEGMGFDFVDLNFGCPVKKVVKKGAGAAVLKDPQHLSCILNKVKSSITIPLTIKIRTGWDDGSKNADQICHIAYNEGVTWVTIHGRTRSQGYSGQADWNYIQHVKSKSQIPVIGNGDILNPQQAVERLKQSKCDGVMLGRGCLKRPSLIKDAESLYKQGNISCKTDPIKTLSLLHHHLKAHLEERKVFLQMKKFASWYSSGYLESSLFRKTIFQSKTFEDLFQQCHAYFEKVKGVQREDEDPFMMGGHG